MKPAKAGPVAADGPGRGRFRRWVTAALAAACCTAARAAPAVSEVQLKAAFLFHFTQFVVWSEKDFPTPGAPFVIGVFGPDPIDAALRPMVLGERVGGHPLEVRHLSSPSEVAGCSMVYVPDGAEEAFRSARTGTDPVLTVGESDRFLATGGMIEFFSDHSHVRLRINLEAARASSLQISSKLLRVAQVVSPSSLAR
jgi:YfiR/HmsC-like